MQLTRFSDYSLRVLMFLAARPDQRAQVSEIAEAYDISAGHVSKVVALLAGEGLLSTRRGREGGIELGKPASEIVVGQVVRLTETGAPIVECFEPETDHCRVTPVCGLRHALHAAREAFFAELDRYTVADLVRRPAPFLELLSIRPAPARSTARAAGQKHARGRKADPASAKRHSG